MESWERDAACKDAPTRLWFGPGDGTQERLWTAAPLAVCAACPVKIECLEANVLVTSGVFGGTTPNERKAIRAARGLPLWPSVFEEGGQSRAVRSYSPDAIRKREYLARKATG